MYNVNAIDIIHYLVSIRLTLGTQLSFSPPRNSLFYLFAYMMTNNLLCSILFIILPYTLHYLVSTLRWKKCDRKEKEIKPELLACQNSN